VTSTSPRESWLTTPRAILLGAFVIGAFAHAGLRDRRLSVPTSSAPTTTAVAPSAAVVSSSPSPALDANTAAPAIAPTPSFVPVAERSVVERNAERALTEHLPTLRRVCWKNRPAEARVRLMMNVSFDPSGAQVARGISEPRLPESQRPWLIGLGPCVAETLPPLSIAPPGATVQVEIPIDFP
jgi:hypothetical protein